MLLQRFVAERPRSRLGSTLGKQMRNIPASFFESAHSGLSVQRETVRGDMRARYRRGQWLDTFAWRYQARLGVGYFLLVEQSTLVGALA